MFWLHFKKNLIRFKSQSLFFSRNIISERQSSKISSNLLFMSSPAYNGINIGIVAITKVKSEVRRFFDSFGIDGDRRLRFSVHAESLPLTLLGPGPGNLGIVHIVHEYGVVQGSSCVV